MAEQQKVLNVTNYGNLGNTGLLVSRISFGNWLNSDDKNNKDLMVKLVQKAWDLGINFFDTAEVYGNGEAERQFGVALKALNVPRHKYVLSTKIFYGPDRETDPNDVGLSRKHIIEGLKNSLARLQHDYVDVVFCHRFDHLTPLEETCKAMDYVVKQGWATYWATSEWTASQIFEAFMICDKFGLARPIADQCQYNILERQKVEADYARLFDLYGYGTTVWSPLAGGLLTGKYNSGVIEGSRLDTFKDYPFIKAQINNLPQVQEKLTKMGNIAKSLGITQAQLAMAWVLYTKDVSTAITGASSEKQLEDTVQAINAVSKLTPEVLQQIEDIFGTRPDQGIHSRGNDKKTFFGTFPNRR